MAKKKVSVREWEEKFLEVEGIEATIRASEGDRVGDYDFQRAAAGSMSYADLLQNRIKPTLDGKEVSIKDGNFRTPHGRTKLCNVRNSYGDD